MRPKKPKSQRRSNGGRPRKPGDRYASGKLKPAGPSARALEIRKGMGLNKLNQRMVPLDVAHERGWLSDIDYLTGIRFANLHQSAGFARSKASMASTLEVDVPTDVSLSVSLEAKSFFAGLPHAELAALWDRVFDRSEPNAASAEEAAAKAMRHWKAACRAMTMEERAEVTNVCVLDSWPQWIIQRAAGHEETAWEAKRELLLRGLARIRQALRAPRPTEAQSLNAAPVTPYSAGPKRIEHTVYIDANDNVLFEAERVVRRNTAA